MNPATYQRKRFRHDQPSRKKLEMNSIFSLLGYIRSQITQMEVFANHGDNLNILHRGI